MHGLVLATYQSWPVHSGEDVPMASYKELHAAHESIPS